jgi:hypothetical protein
MGVDIMKPVFKSGTHIQGYYVNYRGIDQKPLDFSSG